MKKLTLTASILAVALTFSGCDALNQTLLGTGIGTAAGAALGAGIGRVTGNTGAGAAIGAVVGGAAGAVIGNRMQKQKEELAKQLPNTQVEMINDGQAIKVVFDSGLLFNTNSSNLSTASKADLGKFASNLLSNPDTMVEIVGHTDSSGNDNINEPLSRKRAESVYSFLRDSGVKRDRMSFDGKGSREPVASNSTAEGKQKNRRVEVYILPSQKMISEAQAAGKLK